MEKNCPACKTAMEPARINAGGGLFCLMAKGKSFKSKLSQVDAFVCPDCGYTAFYAEKPELFRSGERR